MGAGASVERLASETGVHLRSGGSSTWQSSGRSVDWILGRPFLGGFGSEQDIARRGDINTGEYFVSDDDKAVLRALDDQDAASMAALEQEGADALGRVLRSAARSQAQSVGRPCEFAAELERRRALARFALCLGSLLQDQALLLCPRSSGSTVPPGIGSFVVPQSLK